MYGDGATYDAIEGRFRIIRKEADKLKTEIDSGTRAPAPPRGTGQARSPRKNRRQASVIDLDTVETGRISKPSSVNNSPSKRRSAAQIKKELLESSASTSTFGEGSASNAGQSEGEDTYIPADMGFDPAIFHSFHDATVSMTTDPTDLSFFDDFGEPQQLA